CEEIELYGLVIHRATVAQLFALWNGRDRSRRNPDYCSRENPRNSTVVIPSANEESLPMSA
ncbi:MAG: hypothetical protein M1546_00090, partial [Chloroflexi bacterium]|nr:hypothetical protein [Chloroflexota bacterium]